jgi:hypothetical protein
VEDKDEIDPTEPLNAFGEQIVNLSPKIITGKDGEEELQVPDEDITRIPVLLGGQAVWMQKIENKVDKFSESFSYSIHCTHSSASGQKKKGTLNYISNYRLHFLRRCHLHFLRRCHPHLHCHHQCLGCSLRL